MTAFNITLSDRIRCFGVDPSNKWGTLQWGQLWGSGNVDIQTDVIKSLSDGIATANTFNIQDLQKSLSDSIITIQIMASEYLIDSNGYYHVFRGGTTNAEDRAENIYSKSSSLSVWTKETKTTTPWS